MASTCLVKTWFSTSERCSYLPIMMLRFRFYQMSQPHSLDYPCLIDAQSIATRKTIGEHLLALVVSTRQQGRNYYRRIKKFRILIYNVPNIQCTTCLHICRLPVNSSQPLKSMNSFRNKATCKDSLYVLNITTICNAINST